MNLVLPGLVTGLGKLSVSGLSSWGWVLWGDWEENLVFVISVVRIDFCGSYRWRLWHCLGSRGTTGLVKLSATVSIKWLMRSRIEMTVFVTDLSGITCWTVCCYWMITLVCLGGGGKTDCRRYPGVCVWGVGVQLVIRRKTILTVFDVYLMLVARIRLS